MNLKPNPAQMDGEETYHLATIEQEAAGIIEDAQRKADEILKQAREATQAFQLGKNKVQDYARHQQTQLRQLSSALTSLIENLEKQWKEFTRNVEVELPKLAFAIAELLVGKEIDKNDNVLKQAISRAARLAIPEARWQVLVNPADLDAARHFLPDLDGKLQAAGWLVLCPSEHVRRGGCLLKSEGVEIDATLETQLAQIKRTMLAELPAPTSQPQPGQLSKSGKELTADVYTSG